MPSVINLQPYGLEVGKADEQHKGPGEHVISTLSSAQWDEACHMDPERWERVKLAEEDKLGLQAQLNIQLQPVSTTVITTIKRWYIILDDS